MMAQSENWSPKAIFKVALYCQKFVQTRFCFNGRMDPELVTEIGQSTQNIPVDRSIECARSAIVQAAPHASNVKKIESIRHPKSLRESIPMFEGKEGIGALPFQDPLFCHS